MSLRSFRLVLFAIAALLLTPSAASAAWTVTPTPNVAGADDTFLNAVDCSSASSCMAVGNATFTPAFRVFRSTTVAERWDGTSWQIVPSPNPPEASSSSLHGISCPRRNVCFAVGSWSTPPPNLPPPYGPPGIGRPLIERWDGTSWSIQPSPDVAHGNLDAVSCSGLRACTAVGSVSGAPITTLAERWDGTGWHVQSTPNPTGSESRQLSSVSCPLKRTCTAVGTATTFNASGGHSSPLVERWFGRVNAWGLEAAPKPGGFDSGFSGVSCPDGRVCFAVGASLSSLGIVTFAERRIGSSWSIMPTPNPGPYQGPNGPVFNAQLSSVSCPGRRSCHAVGIGFPVADDQFGTFAERFDGVSWQLESIPTAGLQVSDLSGVSCPSRLFCMAVGTVLGSSGAPATLSAKWTP